MTVEHTPHRLRRICIVLAVLVVIVFGVLALLLPEGTTNGQAFGVADQVAFFGIGNGDQRSCEGVASTSSNGALRINPLSIR